MLTAPPRPRRAAVRAPRLWRCLDAIGAAGAPAVGAAAGAAALGADDLGVIGACAHAAGAAIARAAAIATPFKRCFMPLSSVAVLDWDNYAATACYTRGRPSQASGRKQPSCCSVPANTQLFRSRIRPRRERII